MHSARTRIAGHVVISIVPTPSGIVRETTFDRNATTGFVTYAYGARVPGRNSNEFSRYRCHFPLKPVPKSFTNISSVEYSYEYNSLYKFQFSKR